MSCPIYSENYFSEPHERNSLLKSRAVHLIGGVASFIVSINAINDQVVNGGNTLIFAIPALMGLGFAGTAIITELSERLDGPEPDNDDGDSDGGYGGGDPPELPPNKPMGGLELDLITEIEVFLNDCSQPVSV